MSFIPGEEIPIGAPVGVVPQPPVVSPIGSISTLQPGLVPTPQVVTVTPTVTKPKERGYWDVPELCHPGQQPVKCPITFYIILIIVGIIINIWALFKAPRRDVNERVIEASQLWWAFFVGAIFYLVFGLLFGWWIYQQCRECRAGSRWLLFLLALFGPVVIAVLTGVIMGEVLNVGFLWTAANEPNR